MPRFVVLVAAVLCVVDALALEKPWKPARRAAPSDPLEFSVGLFQPRKEALFAEIRNRANPHHALYGRWLTRAQVDAFVTPSAPVRLHVRSQLRALGLTVLEDRGDNMRVSGPASAVEAAFSTECFHYSHTHDASRTLLRCLNWTVPRALRSTVEIVAGLTELPLRRKRPLIKRAVSRKTPPDFEYVSPTFVRWLYNMTSSDTATGASIAVVEFLDSTGFLQSDLDDFAAQMAVAPIGPVRVVGSPAPGAPALEGTLDLQYAASLAYGANVTYWAANNWILSFAQSFYASRDQPAVVSMSFGVPEVYTCNQGIGNCTNANQYIERANTELAKITALGITLVAASGDNGAPGDANDQCTDGYSDIFPGGSPWVLSVGATMIGTRPGDKRSRDSDGYPPYTPPPFCTGNANYTCAIGDYNTEEIAVWPTALITSGGGFSDNLPAPDYQTAAIEAYFHHFWTIPPPGYNKSNRGFPDVAGMGHHVLVCLQGGYYLVDGSSLATPIWAGMFATINAARAAVGKRSVGFVNPALYGAPPGLTRKIVKGNNGCTTGCCGNYGFYARDTQWDPVGGLGTPNFVALLAHFRAAK